MDLAAPSPPDAKESVAHCFYRHSEGNPFFMISAIRYFKSTGALSEIDGKWCVEPGLSDTALKIPPNVEKLLLYSLEQLDLEDQYLLKVACLQGVEFDSATVSEVSGVSITEVEERLRACARVHEVIRHLGDSELNAVASVQHYRFVHTVFWKALQDSIVPSRRTALGSKIAELRRRNAHQTA